MAGSKSEVYKTVGDVRLQIYRYEPAGHHPSDKRPAAVFFFGGGWRSGSPQQFQQHCEYLASRGMVALAADYRVSSRHNVKVTDCIRDAKSAIRWVRSQAPRLGIDPDRIVACGGSAGGHLAAACGVIRDLDEPGEDLGISSVPNALVLFNPALVLAPIEGKPILKKDAVEGLRERMGTKPEAVSPYHHVAKGQPATLIIHGRADTTVPYSTAEAFAEAMQKAGNRCELAGYDGQGHGFFNAGRGNGEYYLRTVRKLDEFLASLHYLEGPPTLSQP
jgi:acetyl esterase/lipase